MANKKTIQDVDAALDKWHGKLNMAVRKINELRELRKKLVTGKVKHPAPLGKKIMFPKSTGTITADEFGDLIPSFGPNG